MALRLLTSDSRSDDLVRTTLDLTTVIDDVEANSNAKALVLIVDTCFAGQTIPKNDRKLKKHLFVLAATDARGLAWDGPNSLTAVMASILGDGVSDWLGAGRLGHAERGLGGDRIGRGGLGGGCEALVEKAVVEPRPYGAGDVVQVEAAGDAGAAQL